MNYPKKILVIQTAFIGDVILATSLLESIHYSFPDAIIDMMVRKGNEGLLEKHPYLNHLFVWDKKNGKYKNLFFILKQVRSNNYDFAFNLQRFFSSGVFTVLSKAQHKIGFKKNPLSFLFSKRFDHEIDPSIGTHEIERNHLLLKVLGQLSIKKPKLYPSPEDFWAISKHATEGYFTIAPASVWFTKQFPMIQWTRLIQSLPGHLPVYLLGSIKDQILCNEIIALCPERKLINLCGKLSFLQSAALMKDARMNFVNDSAPLHIASAMNANTTAIFCSTVPGFGFGPLADSSMIVEYPGQLSCRPCGLHGKKSCPQGHFKCAMDIDATKIYNTD